MKLSKINSFIGSTIWDNSIVTLFLSSWWSNEQNLFPLIHFLRWKVDLLNKVFSIINFGVLWGVTKLWNEFRFSGAELYNWIIRSTAFDDTLFLSACHCEGEEKIFTSNHINLTKSYCMAGDLWFELKNWWIVWLLIGLTGGGGYYRRGDTRC